MRRPSASRWQRTPSLLGEVLAITNPATTALEREDLKPAAARVWWCSLRTLIAYWTGISYQANGTMRAPSDRCRS